MLGDAVCHEANNYTSVNEGGHHRSFEADLELVLDGVQHQHDQHYELRSQQAKRKHSDLV